MATTFPIYSRFIDDFADGVIDPRYMQMPYYGSLVEANGVLRATVNDAAGERGAAIVVMQAILGGYIGVDIAPQFPTPAAGHLEATLVIMSGQQWSIGAMVEPTGWSVCVWHRHEPQGANVEVVKIAVDGPPARLFVRSHADGSADFGYVPAGGDAAEVIAHSFGNSELIAGAVAISCGATNGAPGGYNDFDNLTIESDAARVDRVSPALLGVHLSNTLQIFGAGFGLQFGELEFPPVATLDGAACEVTLIDAGRAEIVTPIIDTPGPHTLVFCPYANGLAFTIDLVASDAGYRILRALLPPDRYPCPTSNLFAVNLAAWGLEFDLLEAALNAATDREIHVETTEALIDRHERKYGLPIAAGDDLEERRARCLMRELRTRDVSRLVLRAIARAVLPGVELTENFPYATYGLLIWQYQAYEPSRNYLSRSIRAALLDALEQSGPAWTQPKVGARGFVVGCSKVGRDFLGSET